VSLPLLDNLGNLRERLASVSDLFVVLDYDGTLTRIVDWPGNAWLETDARRLVAELARRPHVKVVIASGRALDDLRLRVGIPNLIYVGNHGLEMNGPGFTFDRIAPATTEEDLSRLANLLREKLGSMSGIVLENKRLSVSVHYRLAPDDAIERIRQIVLDCVGTGGANLRVLEGLKVFDIQPNITWNKGSASAWLRRVLGMEKALSICIGDDRTDEDAFAALSDGITIKVGPDPATAAAYVLPGPPEVRRFLQWLFECPLAPMASDPVNAAS
jgi:trehalose-phosphatase